MKFYVAVNTSSGIANKVFYSGFADVTNEISGPIDFTIETTRCDVDMKKCEKLPSQKVLGVCQKLNDKKTFYHGAISTMQPPLACPLKPQKYVATNSSIDLSAIAFLPISGHVWHLVVKLYSGEKKERNMVMCVTIKIKITRAPRKRN